MAIKKLPRTPRSQVRAALRRLFLRSRERTAAIKREKNTCELCGKKSSVAKGREVKINVHHKDGIDWDRIIDLVIERILHEQSRLQVVCVDCHKDHHKESKSG